MRRYYYEDARWPWRPDSFLPRFLKTRPQRHKKRRAIPIRALDLGMGYGRNALWLAERGYAVEGWENDARYIREARREARRRGLELTCKQGDFTRARLRGPYAVIVISNVLHQVRRSQALKVLRRARAALAPEGRLFLLVKLTTDRYIRRVMNDPDWEGVRGERNTWRRLRSPGGPKSWRGRRRTRRWVLSALEPSELKAALGGPRARRGRLRIRHWREVRLRSEWEEPEPVTHLVAEVVAQKPEGG